ncbi:GRAM domain containing [Seminavis robusta]|uniref:GRAM domain containing n=1 Tax=Seminavis robusta TaxID=568900 RepID=A0A9N8HQX5_9STRA|nr:GRAM domain containing [Seminavis robusta]|eukprot:Sro1203_g252070.1 GRAM domain containing (793) ;mRNA; f:10745-13240
MASADASVATTAEEDHVESLGEVKVETSLSSSDKIETSSDRGNAPAASSSASKDDDGKEEVPAKVDGTSSSSQLAEEEGDQQENISSNPQEKESVLQQLENLDALASVVPSQSEDSVASLRLHDEAEPKKEREIEQNEPECEEKSEKEQPQDTEPLEVPKSQSTPSQQQAQPAQPQTNQSKRDETVNQPQQFTPPRSQVPLSSSSATTEIVKSMFGPSVGLCWGDFSCQHNHVRGRLYASSEAVLFYSNIFGFEKKIALRYDDVQQMQLYRATSIQVSVLDKPSHGEDDVTHYVFKGFSDRAQTLQILIDLWQQSQGAENIEAPEEAEEEIKLASSSREELPPQQSSIQAPGTSTTHSMSPGAPDEERAAITATATTTTRQPSNVPLPQSILRPSKLSTPPSKSQSPARMDTAQTPQRLFPDLASSAARRGRSKSLPPLHRRKSFKRSQSPGTEASGGSGTGTDAKDNTSPSTDSFDWDKSPSEGDLAAWNNAKKNADACIKDIGIKPMSLACSLATFFKLFLTDDAPNSVDKYQRGDAVKDVDVVITPWKEEDSSSDPGITLVRTINFRHPVSSSFGVGPSHAPTKKRQRMFRYPGCGICISSSTNVEGLPGADCFVVEDWWIIEVSKPGNDRSGVTFSAKFGSKFTKYTFLKGVIQKNIKSGNIDWFRGYEKMVHAAVKEHSSSGDDSASVPDKDAAVASINLSPTSEEDGTTFGDTFQNLIGNKGGVVLLVVVVVASQLLVSVVFFLLVMDMRRSQKTSETLLEEMKLLRLEHGQMLEVLVKQGREFGE